MVARNAFAGLAEEPSLAHVIMVLREISARLQGLQMLEAGTGRLQVTLTSGTVTTVSAMSAVGGYNMQYDQYGQMMQGAMQLRSGISVTP